MGQELSPAIRERRRERILDVAAELFLEQGYAAATMSMVSQRMGGSKATLYAYFPSKELLCEAIFQRLCDRVLDALDLTGPAADLQGRLTHVGMGFMQALVADEGVRTFQLAVESSRANADLARRFETIALAVTDKLARLIAQADAAGEIAAPDPVEAANVFISLMRGDLHLRRLLNLEPEPGFERRRLEVARAIRVFVAAYAAPSQGASGDPAGPALGARRQAFG